MSPLALLVMYLLDLSRCLRILSSSGEGEVGFLVMFFPCFIVTGVGLACPPRLKTPFFFTGWVFLRLGFRLFILEACFLFLSVAGMASICFFCMLLPDYKCQDLTQSIRMCCQVCKCQTISKLSDWPAWTKLLIVTLWCHLHRPKYFTMRGQFNIPSHLKLQYHIPSYLKTKRIVAYTFTAIRRRTVTCRKLQEFLCSRSGVSISVHQLLLHGHLQLNICNNNLYPCSLNSHQPLHSYFHFYKCICSTFLKGHHPYIIL